MATPKSLDLLIVGGPKKPKKGEEAESPRELAMKGLIEAINSGDVTEALAAWDTLEAGEEVEEPKDEEA
jgi:hypothetical protein